MGVQLPPLIYRESHEVDYFERSVSMATKGLPVQLTSWWRSVEENRLVHGHPNSQHLVGLAMDFVGPAWALRIAAHRARDLALTPVSEVDHLHLQMFPPGYLESVAELNPGGVLPSTDTEE